MIDYVILYRKNTLFVIEKDVIIFGNDFAFIIIIIMHLLRAIHPG